MATKAKKIRARGFGRRSSGDRRRSSRGTEGHGCVSKGGPQELEKTRTLRQLRAAMGAHFCAEQLATSGRGLARRLADCGAGLGHDAWPRIYFQARLRRRGI